MKDSEDKELQDYLNGRDKLSATYQSLQDEKPSAALDESILQAARDSVANKARQKKAIPAQAYSIAASICVAVLVASLFLNNESELTGNQFESFSIPLSDIPGAEMMSADDSTLANQNTVNANDAAEAIEIRANRVPSPAPQLEADSFAATGAAVPSTATDLVEAEAETEAATSTLEEVIIVTAQRQETAEQAIAMDMAIFTGYRDEANTWLAEIQALTDAGSEDEIAEERRLFAERYPDIDIDSALADLLE